MTNYGDAYSANSGFFIAPVNGLYSFTAYMQVTYNIFSHIKYLVTFVSMTCKINYLIRQ